MASAAAISHGNTIGSSETMRDVSLNSLNVAEVIELK